MRAAFSEFLASLVESPLVRRVLDVVFSARARLHLVWLDRIRPERAQFHTLRRLVREHAHTDFARRHDFARIRDEADFRRLVPLRRPGPLPMTPELLATHRRGLRSALALCIHGCARRVRLLTRPLVWLGDDGQQGLWLPRLVRGLAVTDPVAEAGCLIGPASRVVPWVNSGTACITWNDGTPAVGIELLVRPEGTFAVNDPRYGLFRLLMDHGAYYEFIPLEDVGSARPRRLGFAETQSGETYELVVSTPGAWATRTGVGVVFEDTGPLFRRVDLPVTAPTEKVTRPRSTGIPVTLPETSVRIPWSAPADRG